MCKSYNHLSSEERAQIYILKKSGDSSRKIGQKLRRSASTISRELKRNKGGKGYRPKQAQELSQKRRSKACERAPKIQGALKDLIDRDLGEKQFSPEQLSGRLKGEGGPLRISHTAIYAYVAKDKRLGGKLWKSLRHGKKKYRRGKNKESGPGCIPNRVDIDQRPVIVNRKRRYGDLEIDTIIGGEKKGAIVSLVDRKSKYTWLKLVKSRDAEEVKKAIFSSLLAYKDHIHTLTSDNGKEFSKHVEIQSVLGAGFYFAKAYQSWQRGLNEMTNGFVRQYFPKGTSFLDLTQEDVQKVADLLNCRPRASLKFKTPNEMWLGFLEKNGGAL
jgi:IS30 family transposase